MSNKVTGSKPKIGGAVFRGDEKAVLPTDVSADLTGFKNLGYVSEDGVTNSNSPETEDVKAWGGAVVYTVTNGRPDTFKFKMIEAYSEDVLGTVYGSDNVKGTLEKGIAVTANSDDMPECPYVFDMIMKNNILKRIVVPRGTVKEVGEIQYANGVVGYEVTINAAPDDNGNTHYEYIKGAASA